MRTCLPLAVVAACCLGGPPAARGEDLDRILVVLDAIKSRHDGYNPVDLRYRVRRTLTKYYFASSSNIEPEDKKLWARLREATCTFRCQFSQKGNQWLMIAEGPAYSNEGVQVAANTRAVSAYDGTLFRTTGSNNVVTVSRKKPAAVDEPLKAFTGEEMMLRLRDILKAGTAPSSVTVTPNPPKVPGAALYFRVVFGKDEASYDVWVSPSDQGSGVLRMESRVGGKLFHEYTDCRYKPVDGVWFPHHAVYRNYYHNKDTHQVAAEKQFDVDKLTCRADEIPDSQFQIPTQADTKLIDRDRKNLLIVEPDQVEKHIREAAAEVERERSGGGWLPWVYGSASVLFLAGAGFMVVRTVRARRQAKGPAAETSGGGSSHE
jgi:hypothetical protein